MQDALKLALAAAAVIAVVVAGLNLVPRSESAVVGPPSSPARLEHSRRPRHRYRFEPTCFRGARGPTFSVLCPPGWYMCCTDFRAPGTQ